MDLLHSPLQAEKRAAEVKKMGLKAKIVLIGKKGITYFNRRTDQYDIVGMSCCPGCIIPSLHPCVVSGVFMCNIVSMCMCTTCAMYPQCMYYVDGLDMSDSPVVTFLCCSFDS